MERQFRDKQRRELRLEEWERGILLYDWGAGPPETQRWLWVCPGMCLPKLEPMEEMCLYWRYCQRRKKRDKYHSFSYLPPSSLGPVPPIGQTTQKLTLRGAWGPILPYRAGKAWIQETIDVHHSAGIDSPSKACSDVAYTCQLGLRTGLPEMSVGHGSKGSSFCVFLGMGGILLFQFPSSPSNGLKCWAFSRPALKSSTGLG